MIVEDSGELYDNEKDAAGSRNEKSYQPILKNNRSPEDVDLKTEAVDVAEANKINN